VAPPGNQAANGENKHQPDVLGETGQLDLNIRKTSQIKRALGLFNGNTFHGMRVNHGGSDVTVP
jgi:hypothetical protein